MGISEYWKLWDELQNCKSKLKEKEQQLEEKQHEISRYCCWFLEERKKVEQLESVVSRKIEMCDYGVQTEFEVVELGVQVDECCGSVSAAKVDMGIQVEVEDNFRAVADVIHSRNTQHEDGMMRGFEIGSVRGQSLGSGFVARECIEQRVDVKSCKGVKRELKCLKCGQKGHEKDKCFQRGCFGCGTFGHIVKNCNVPGGECFLCGLHGHLKKFCPNGKRCYGCGAVGHIFTYCPHRQVVQSGFYINDGLNWVVDKVDEKVEESGMESFTKELVLKLLKDERHADYNMGKVGFDDRWRRMAECLDFCSRVREEIGLLESWWYGGRKKWMKCLKEGGM